MRLNPERRWSYGVVLTLLETHLPNAFDLLAPVPYFVVKAARPAARSVLQDLAAAIVAAWLAWLAADAVTETHLPNVPYFALNAVLSAVCAVLQETTAAAVFA